MIDENLIEEYLKTVKTESTREKVRLRMRFFCEEMKKINPGVIHPFDLTEQNIVEFWKIVDEKNALPSVKNHYRHDVDKFFRFVRKLEKKIKDGKKIQFEFSEVFDREEYSFDDTGKHREETPLEMKHLLDIIEYMDRNGSFEDRILFRTLIYTGMRIGGALSIKLSTINLNRRRIVTKEKITKHNHINDYVIPNCFKSQLESYMEQIRLLEPNRIYLFTMNRRTYATHLKNWAKSWNLRNPADQEDLEIDPHLHLFRDALNTIRTDLEPRMFRGIMHKLTVTECEYLINQKPQNMNERTYLKLKKNFQYRRELYDTFFPFE